MRSLWIVGIAGCLLAGAVASAQTRYTVLVMGKPVGTQVSTLRPDGEREFAFEYSLRGYGPKLLSRVRLDAQGLPVAIDTSGSNYLKMPVQERFNIADGVARWKNGEQSGERRLSGRYYYLSAQSVPEEMALLANALLKAPEGRLALLPEGEASIRRTDEVTLNNGAAMLSVSSYEVTGLDFTPSTVWLDHDRRFFAMTSGWLAVVREGWESSVPELVAKQDASGTARRRELAKRLIRQPAGPLAITNANLFDAETGRSTPGTTILLAGNRIEAVGADGTVPIPAQAERIDAAGRAALPGLWDMHTHIGRDHGVLHMAAGVTSVRDLGNDTDLLLATRKEIDAGELIGPRIIAIAGLVDGRGPYAGPTKVLVDTPAEAQTAVESYAQLGYEGIKIYSSIRPELVPVIIRHAHAKGLRASGHVPAFMSARQFIEAGADELQHLNFVFLNFYFDDVKDTRTPVRITALAERAATLDLSSEPVRSFVRLLRDKHTVVDPTVNVYEAALTDRPGVVPRRYAAIADRLPVQVRRGLLEGGFPVPAGQDSRYRDSSRAVLRMVKLLHDSGVTLVAGSDAMAGFALLRELELYEEAGIPAPEVLRIATIGAARVLKREHELGSIAPGKLADLLLVDGDPARRIADLRRISLVIKNGQLLRPAALYESVGVRADAASDDNASQVVAWSAKHAVPLTDSMEPLRNIVGDARVLAFGEGTHNAHQLWTLRNQMFAYAVEQLGFTAIAAETSYAEGLIANDYAQGKAVAADAAARGVFSWSSNVFDENHALIEWMRAYNAKPGSSRKVRFYGLEMSGSLQPEGRSLVRAALDYVRSVDAKRARTIEERLAPLLPIFDEQRWLEAEPAKRTELTVAVQDLVSLFERHQVPWTGKSSFDSQQRAYRHAIAARQLVAHFRMDGEGRDIAAAENLRWVLEREGPKGRVFVFAHNSHVAQWRIPPADENQLHSAMGELIQPIVGDDMVVIGSLYHQGESRDWLGLFGFDNEVRPVPPSKPESLNAVMARVGVSRFLLDLRKLPDTGTVPRWFAEPRPVRNINVPEQYNQIRPAAAFDALLFVRDISPLRARGQSGTRARAPIQ